MITIGIDPGKRGCGVAIFEGSVLHAATYVRGSQEKAPSLLLANLVAHRVVDFCRAVVPLPAVCTIAIEVPRIYPAGQHKGDQNDLIDVAMVSSACAAALFCLLPSADLRAFYPRDWKGTIDADVMTKRIESRLTAAERLRFTHVSSTLDHNTIDAVGICLHVLGRLTQERKIFR